MVFLVERNLKMVIDNFEKNNKRLKAKSFIRNQWLGFNKYLHQKMDSEITQEQMELALRLCDILSLEDFTVATSILNSCDWSLQKALTMLENELPQNKHQQSNSHSLYENAYNYDDIEPEQYDYQEYENQFSKQVDLENKKKMFQNQYISIPLKKTSSSLPNKLQSQLIYDRLLKNTYANHRHVYQGKLLKNSEQFCESILNNQSQEIKHFYANQKKNENNIRFLSYLHKKYQTRINFTFGTFFLNLVRSYLDKKYLLVYIHRSQLEENRSIEMILTQQQIANFINIHCISYGMFDSSDDYEIIQKYIPMKNLPALGLYRFNKKEQKQDFISQYVICQKNQVSIIEWISKEIGVILPKKEQKNQKVQEKMEGNEFYYSLTDIVNEQNEEYEEMAKIYQLKRQKSKIKQEKANILEAQLEEKRKRFLQYSDLKLNKPIEIKFRLPMSGKSISYIFSQQDKVQKIFHYIDCFGRDQFQDISSDFDLAQTFPKLSLHGKKDLALEEIFQDSERQNIIVKQL